LPFAASGQTGLVAPWTFGDTERGGSVAKSEVCFEADMNDWNSETHSSPKAVSDEKSPTDRFRELVRQWKAERGPTSSVKKMAAHPAYRHIVDMGKTAVPLLLAELEREPDHWFLALYEITGEDPVPVESRGRLREMAAAWLKWGKQHGFVW
jgi:hypothetical protein